MDRHWYLIYLFISHISSTQCAIAVTSTRWVLVVHWFTVYRFNYALTTAGTLSITTAQWLKCWFKWEYIWSKNKHNKTNTWNFLSLILSTQVSNLQIDFHIVRKWIQANHTVRYIQQPTTLWHTDYNHFTSTVKYANTDMMFYANLPAALCCVHLCCVFEWDTEPLNSLVHWVSSDHGDHCFLACIWQRGMCGVGPSVETKFEEFCVSINCCPEDELCCFWRPPVLYCCTTIRSQITRYTLCN